jgi:type IV pilus biogenesis protein CpaD/CtpE
MKNIPVKPLLICLALSLLSACATIKETVVSNVSDTHKANLLGNAIVGGAGDANGFAKAEISVIDTLDQICYELKTVNNLGNIRSVAVHRGDAKTNGPVVLDFIKAKTSGWKNCVNVDEKIENGFKNLKEPFYVLVMTDDYPDGAVRGQLLDD